MRPIRRTSSQSWHLPPSERRELVLARYLPGAVELILARVAEAGGDPDQMPSSWRVELEEDVARIMRSMFGEGAENEADLRSARDGERALRHRLEALLREHGIPVPTDPKPSEPP